MTEKIFVQTEPTIWLMKLVSGEQIIAHVTNMHEEIPGKKAVHRYYVRVRYAMNVLESSDVGSRWMRGLRNPGMDLPLPKEHIMFLVEETNIDEILLERYKRFLYTCEVDEKRRA